MRVMDGAVTIRAKGSGIASVVRASLRKRDNVMDFEKWLSVDVKKGRRLAAEFADTAGAAKGCASHRGIPRVTAYYKLLHMWSGF